MRRLPAWSVAVVVAALYLVLAPPSADLAAQTYRTWLFEHAGWTAWDDGWYGGHHVPAYSTLFPPLAALIGPRVVGALAAVAAAWAFERLVAGARGAAARPAALWFALGTGVSLASGRLTFALGLAFGVATLLALQRDRRALAAAAAVATGLSSPVAAAFLALALVAWAVVRRRLVLAAALLAAALGPVLAMMVAFPEGGSFPFAPSSFWPALGVTVGVLLALPRREPLLRAGVALYAVALAASAALTTPMGGNAARLGPLLAGPLAAYALWPLRRRRLLLLALPLLVWQWSTAFDDVLQASRDPSVNAAYYTGLLRFLRAQPGGPFRIEIPFTDDHWESARVAGGRDPIPLARGWERQLDRELDPLFYDGRPLTAARYRRWLDDHAVRFVALPDAPIDYSAAAEAALVRSRPSYLRPAWHDAHWRVFAVADPVPLAGGGARVTRLGTDSVALVAPGPGRYVVRVHWTPYWRLTGGRGCVEPAGQWTAVRLDAGGPVRLQTDFALGRLRATSPRCTA